MIILILYAFALIALPYTLLYLLIRWIVRAEMGNKAPPARDGPDIPASVSNEAAGVLFRNPDGSLSEFNPTKLTGKARSFKELQGLQNKRFNT